MTPEQKAEAYNKALEKIKELVSCGLIYKDAAIQIFPELKESEDEKIRKCLLYHFSRYQQDEVFLNNIKMGDIVAWLEKQGEQKATIEMKSAEESLGIDSDTYNKIVDECIYGEQKPTDVEEVNFFDDFRKTDSEVEPKFHEGEWITNGDYTWKIVEVKPLDYILQSQDGNIVDDTISHVDEQFHSFTIEDAKDGDVLMANAPFIFNGNLEGGKGCPGAHCGINTLGKFQIPTDKKHWTGHTTTPATKEQRDLLFQKMHEAGYGLDAEKKEVKKIEQKPTDEEMKTLLRTEYEKGRADAIAEIQNPAWSEEDEEELDIAVSTLKKAGQHDSVKWLKSLKGRVQPKQEWSKEDESIALGIEQIVNCASLLNVAPDRLNKVRDWLKSLKQRIGG